MKRAVAAFTLIELLVVTIILGAATAVIGACVAAGLRAYEEARRFGHAEMDLVMAVSFFERDLRNHKPLFLQPFIGEKDRMTVVGLTSSNTLARITHAWFPRQGEWRREVAVWPIGEGVESPPKVVEDSVLMRDLADWTLTYQEAAPAAVPWPAPVPAWSGQTNMPSPAAVELTFSFIASDGQRRTIGRHVAMPVVWEP